LYTLEVKVSSSNGPQSLIQKVGYDVAVKAVAKSAPQHREWWSKKAAMGNTYFPGVSCDEYAIRDFRIHAIVKAGRSVCS
jgi:hypothetical protein